MNISRSHGNVQYYLHENGERRYIKENELKIVRTLCQEDYDMKVLRAAQKELKILEKLGDLYRDDGKESACEHVYEKLSDERRKFVQPIWIPDKEYIKLWESFEYERKGFREDAPEYYTDRGERVRSKTEILIANALEKHNIPYRYECPLYLEDYGLIHPDFTVLNVKRKRIR